VASLISQVSISDLDDPFVDFFAVTLYLAMLIWGLFRVHAAFVSTIIGAFAFATTTATVTLYIQFDPRAMRIRPPESPLRRYLNQ
jgi:hypothetical protein